MNKTQIINYIRECQFPCWLLYKYDGFNKVLLRKYNCEDVPADADINAKLEHCINALELTLSSFPENCKFAIVLKASKEATGTSVYGAIEFVNSETQLQVPNPQPQQPQNNFSGFAGLPDLTKIKALGYVSESELESRLRQNETSMQKQLADMELKLRKQQLEDEYQRKLENLTRLEKETVEEKKKAADGINKLVEVVKLAGVPILQRVFNLPQNSLSGLQEPANDSNNIVVNDARYNEVEKFATALYDSDTSLEEIKKMMLNLKHAKHEFSETETAAS